MDENIAWLKENSPGITDKQLRLIEHLHNLYHTTNPKGVYDRGAGLLDYVVSSVEYILDLNYQTCPRFLPKRSEITITDDTKRSLLWIYNRFLIAHARQQLDHVETWVAIKENPESLSTLKYPVDPNCESWRHAGTDLDLSRQECLWSLLLVSLFRTVVLGDIKLPEQHVPYMTADQLNSQLSALDFDEDKIWISLSRNHGWLYARMFDSQSDLFFRMIKERD